VISRGCLASATWSRLSRRSPKEQLMSQCCQSFTGLITGPIVHESSSQNEEMQIKIKPILLSGFVAFAIDWLFDAQQERTA